MSLTDRVKRNTRFAHKGLVPWWTLIRWLWMGWEKVPVCLCTRSPAQQCLRTLLIFTWHPWCEVECDGYLTWDGGSQDVELMALLLCCSCVPRRCFGLCQLVLGHSLENFVSLCPSRSVNTFSMGFTLLMTTLSIAPESAACVIRL